MQGHLLQQVAVIAEGVSREHVVEVSRRVRQILQCTNLRYDENFGQSEGHALAQLIFTAHCIREPGFEADRIQTTDIESHGHRIRVGCFDGRQQQRGWLGDLRIDPTRVGIRRVAECDQGSRRIFGRTESRLIEKTKCIARRDRGIARRGAAAA